MKKLEQNEKTTVGGGSNTPNLLRLYRLVNVMTPSQKGDFRKYSRFWGEVRTGEEEKGSKGKTAPYYIQLFDAINRFVNDSRDVDGLQKYLERKRLGNRATLSDRAGYLYDCILESLRTTPDRGRLFNQLNGLMQDISTLYHKGLEKDALLLVAEARKIARDLDKPTYLLELLWWENTLKPKETESSKMMATNESIRLAQEQMIRHLNRTSELKSISWALSAESRQVDASLSVVPEQWRAMFEMEVKDAFQTIPGFRSKLFFLLALRTYSEMASKTFPEQRQYWFDKMFESQAMLIKAYRGEFALFAKEEPAAYWSVLTTHITLCRRLNKQAQADELMGILEKEADEHLLIYNRLNKFMASLEVAEALQYIDKKRLIGKFDQFKESLTESRQIIICYQCGFFYFLDKRWSEARRWFAKTLEGHRPDAHHIAVTMTNLLNIICIFESKAYKGPISRLFENFEARQHRAEQWSDFLKNLTELLKNHLVGHDGHDTVSQIKPLQDEISQHKLLGAYGVVLAWIEARLYQTDCLAELKKYN